MGPEVTELEQTLARRVQVNHCVAVSSGTDALLVAMMALNIGPGDEVVTSVFDFISVTEILSLLGAKPVYVDIDPRTYHVDTAQLRQAVNERTKLIVIVNLYGQCADYDEIDNIAKQFNIPVIEDAAQSFGAFYKERPSCSLGTISCTSFYPSKPLGCYGDGGACFTQDSVLAQKMRGILHHGQKGSYNHVTRGITGRLDTLQAAILLAKLTILDEDLHARYQLAQRYDDLLKDAVQIPYVSDYTSSVYAQYTIQVDNREALIKCLQKKGIPVAVHYPKPVNKQPAYAQYADQFYEVAEKVASQVLSLPLYPYMPVLDMERVAEELLACLDE